MREWFELIRGRLPTYRHSRTEKSITRAEGVPDRDWCRERDAFLRRFPRAREVRLPGSDVVLFRVDRMPDGPTQAFSVGDRLVVASDGCVVRRPLEVVGIQVPFPFCGDEPSYLLEDGSIVDWNWSTDAWTSSKGFLMAMDPKARPRRRTARRLVPGGDTAVPEMHP